MSAKFGVNYQITSEAANPISVASTTPLAIVGTATGMTNGLHFFGSVSKAKEAVEGKTGSIQDALKAVYSQAVETPVILSVFTEPATAEKAVELLARAEADTGCRPNVIIAPTFSHLVAGAMQTQAERMNATAVIDLDATDETSAVLKAGDFSSKNMILCYPAVLVTEGESTVAKPLSSYVAGLICRTDAEREYGFSDSFSNRVVTGVVGLQYPVEFQLGADCEADRLRQSNITTVIRYDGFRMWGGETSHAEVIWQDLARVRTFDRIAEACQKGVFYAIDRKASQLYYAKRSVEEICRNLTGSQVLIGYEVSWNKEKNTAATVTQGKFYLDVKMQNNPIVKTLELNFVYVDSYSDKLLADINN